MLNFHLRKQKNGTNNEPPRHGVQSWSCVTAHADGGGRPTCTGADGGGRPTCTGADEFACRRFTVSRQHGCSGYAPSTAWPRWPIRFVSAEEKKAFIAKCPCKLIQLRSWFPNQNTSINNKHSSLYCVIECEML